ncbi:exodeoxyribonuclease V subunit gamma [Ectobacillus funiculus]|uniref:exodeoxyribonuclease V subunit gamma n=1 Tax=Ectobacillus funiculus TaxID=137993 RepID=UPI0013EC2E9B|nr:exodeoxyribonuclease V subunit gamma [Ectobacillus funiculus]
MITLYQYQNKRPRNEKVKEELGLDTSKHSYVYLTATKKMAKEREKLIPSTHQEFVTRKGQKESKEKLALFGDLLKGWVKQSYPGKAATGLEEQTLLIRAIEKVVTTDQELQDILKKDRGSLLKTLKDLAAKNIDLANGFPPNLQDQLLEPTFEVLLPDIQRQFYHELRSKGKVLYEKLAYDYIKQDFVPKFLELFGSYFTIVMEGFTYFTPQQRHLIDVCINNDIRICFLVPNNPMQRKGFEIIERTYASIPGVERKNIDTESISEYPDLQHLQSQFFTKAPVPYEDKATHILVQQYSNRDQELAAILQQIKQLLTNGYLPSEIAIVMRNKKEFLYRLADLLQMRPIIYEEHLDNGQTEQHQVKLPISPRKLLLTPVGRFILTLYEIWEDNELSLSADQLEILLGSGWLGAKAQDLTQKFRAVKHQSFAQCTKKNEWLNVLDSLLPLCRTRRPQERMPINILDQRAIRAWKDVIELLERVCRKLFSTGESAIGQHIRVLQEQLKGILPDDIRQTEKRVLEKVMEVFEELVQEHTIDLSTNEFSRTLHALISDQVNDDDETNDEGDPGELKVYSPETIDGIHVRAVLYIGVDNQHVPAMYTDSWPFFEDVRDEHLEKERYMFLTVLRAAMEKLVLSYSLQDAERSYQPSAYAGTVLQLANAELDKFTVLDALDMSNVPEIPLMPTAIPAIRRNYELNELAHYGLCPARYRLELLHSEARSYRMDWQLPFVAQGKWLDEILQRLQQENDHLPYGDPEKLKIYFIRTMNAVEPHIRQWFSGFNQITWHGIKNKVFHQLINIHWEHRFKYLKGVRGASLEVFSVMNEEEDTIDIEYEVPYYWKTTKFDVPVFDMILHREWLLPADSEGSDEEFVSKNGIRLFSTLGHAVGWWRNIINGHHYKESGAPISQNHIRKALRVFHEAPDLIIEWISGIEGDKFPKNEGTHCNKCPVRMECLGIALDEEGTEE